MQPRREASLLTRPPHQQPVSTWHLTNTREASGPLAKDQVKRFFDDGFVCLPNFYSKEQIETVQVCQKQNFAFVLASSSPTACPLSGLSSVSLAAAHVCKRDVEGQLDRLASRLFASGLVKDRYSGQDWTQRLLSLRQDCSDAPIMLIKEGVLPRGLADLYSDPLVLDAAAQLGVGPDICLNPAWNLRGKMPNYENTVIPWHQDNSYWEPRIWREQVLTIWVALVDATVENGCMQLVRGGHKTGKTARHTVGTTTPTWYTELSEEDLCAELLPDTALEERIVTCEAPAGSIIIFGGTLPHRSLNSTSSNIRWSSDFRLHGRSPAIPSPVGRDLDWFYGLKDSLLLRDGGDPSFAPSDQQWKEWANVDRSAVQESELDVLSKDFDPVVVGPWLDLWDIESQEITLPDGSISIVPNPHTDRYLASAAASRGSEQYMEAGNW